jgi:hypothetical protein
MKCSMDKEVMIQVNSIAPSYLRINLIAHSQITKWARQKYKKLHASNFNNFGSTNTLIL